MGCVVYDKGGTMFRENIFKETMEKYISIYFHQRFAIVPGCWSNKPVIGPLVSPIQKVTPEPMLQATKRFDTFNNIFYADSFTKKLKQPVTE
jgi:hypothetical protein